LQGNTAALRERELAALDPANRALMQQVYALQDQATAAQAAADATAAAAAEQERIAQEAAAKAEQIANERYGLEGQILQLQGNTAAIRQRELEALDPSNRALLVRIYALQDEQAAAQAAQQAAAALAAEQERAAQAAAAEAQARTNERLGLGRELLTALGDTAALRRLELQSIDPANRALKERIWAIQDEAAAVAAATVLAKSHRTLEIALMEATGDAAGALAAKRADELAAMDASLQALQQQVWAAQDAAAAQAAAEAAAEKARQAVEAARQKAIAAAEEAARKAEELAKQRSNLQVQLLEAQGRSTEALAMKRALELAEMDASLRGLQQQVWAAQDAAAAQDKLVSSYRDMISEWQDSVDTFGGLADDLRAYRKSLTTPDSNSAAGYSARRTEFQRLAALAARGDKTAMQGLQGAGDAFLASAMANATSVVQYQRDLSMVLQGLDKSIFAADTTADYAQVQIDALNRQIELLEGIAQNTAVAAPPAVPSAPSTITTGVGTVSAANSLEGEVKALRQDLNAALIAVKQDTGKMARTLERVTDNDRLRVGNDADSPVFTSAVP
jgi:myosin heavy subunit